MYCVHINSGRWGLQHSDQQEASIQYWLTNENSGQVYICQQASVHCTGHSDICMTDRGRYLLKYIDNLSFTVGGRGRVGWIKQISNLQNSKLGKMRICWLIPTHEGSAMDVMYSTVQYRIKCTVWTYIHHTYYTLGHGSQNPDLHSMIRCYLCYPCWWPINYCTS